MSVYNVHTVHSVADWDPHNFGKLDPNPHQSEKVEALEDYFGALEGQTGTQTWE
jgi:hypothetical protein